MVEVSYPGPPYVMEYMNAKIPVNVQTIDMIAPYSMVREIMGTMIRNVLCQKFAPSRLADSRMEGDILVIPPRIMIACQPMENQVSPWRAGRPATLPREPARRAPRPGA